MTIPQIIFFTPGQAYVDSPEAVTEAAVGHIKATSGIQASYRGFQHDDELEAGVKKAVWVNVWDSYDSASKQQDQLKTLFKEENKPEIYHVNIDADLAKPISGRTTEIARIDLKSGESIEALAGLLGELVASLKGVANGHGATLGPTFENPNLYIAILGWDTKQDHLNAVAPGTEAHAIIQRVLAIAVITMLHVDLTKLHG